LLTRDVSEHWGPVPWRDDRARAAIDGASSGDSAHGRPQEGQTLETVIGIALVVISALEIWLIVRVVSSNLKT
jgi:hypothetical protein